MTMPLSPAEQQAADGVRQGAPRGKRKPKTMRFDARKLRELREARGLSRNQLAELCPHVSYAAIRSYEEGRNKPDIDRALELAAALRVALHHLTS